MEIDKERTATAETVNADLKTWRGLDRLLLRGLQEGADRRAVVGAYLQPDAGDPDYLFEDAVELFHVPFNIGRESYSPAGLRDAEAFG